MNTKIIASLAAIAVVGVGAVGVTRALYFDAATISDVTYSAGTYDLRIDSDPDQVGTNWTNGFSFPTPFNNLYPAYPANGEHNWQVIDIKNVGTVNVNGQATLKLTRTSADNELPGNLVFNVYYDEENDGFTDDTTPVISGTLAALNGNAYPLGPMNGPDKIASVKIVWSVLSSAGNEIQGDGVTLNAEFGLNQI